MPRTLLPCPINGCHTSTSGHRINQLVDHFLQEHSHLNRITINLPSNILRPMWQPFSPVKMIPSPPPLPTEVGPGCIVIQPTKPTTFYQDPNISSSLPPSPHKQAHKQILRKEQEQAMDDSTDKDVMDLNLPDFEDIPSLEFQEDELYKIQDLVVWDCLPIPAVDVSRPQPMYGLPPLEPPISMLYEQFAQHVDTLFPVA
ncbi:hypothetical protein BDZ94DRAFT_424617 [Collybia nuda]|uniref:Uncharacterized protein n=1 Tax=Collybia nuda TaxID=64659 RepID=A0A9P5YBS8_9AGAR|nr:hypothetical protein BDZ94DRAFT_424617 [Collybia nuda]